MDIPDGLNLRNDLLGQTFGSWQPVSSGPIRRPAVSPPPNMPAELFTSGHWTHQQDSNLGISVLFEGLKKDEPRYTIKVYYGKDAMSGDLIDQKEHVHARDVKAQTQQLMDTIDGNIEQILNERGTSTKSVADRIRGLIS